MQTVESIQLHTEFSKDLLGGLFQFLGSNTFLYSLINSLKFLFEQGGAFWL